MRDRSIVFFGEDSWACSEIRGRQVAEQGGWVYNPSDIRDDDMLVFIKSQPGVELEKVITNRNSVFVDMVDCYGVIPFLYKVPTATVITMSRMAKKYMESRVDNKIIFIPEHHCNFENELVNSTKLKRIGFIGYKWNFQLKVSDVRYILDRFGIEFVMKTEFTTRQDVVDFYKSIDLQLCFRIPGTIHTLVPQLKNPLKIANAGSFGIPTIAFPEPCYVDECDGCFFPIGSTDGLVHWVEQILDDWNVYNSMRISALDIAKRYHIDVILNDYREVLNGSISNLQS